MNGPLKYVAVSLILDAATSAFVYFGISPAQQTHERIPIRIGNPPGGRIEKTDEEWRARLSEDAYRITRRRGTERACSAAGWDSKADGHYECIGCGLKLFDSAAKYDSGTGWPSFLKPVDEDSISLFLDRAPGLSTRKEVVCSRCDAHLGHVFDDGPKPTGQRYCMNMGAMKFVPR